MNKDLKTFHDKCEMLFKNTKDIVVFLDRKGKIIDINPAVKKIIGFNPEEIKGQHFKELEFLTTKSKKRIAEYFGKRLRGANVPLYYEIEAITKDGKKVIAEVSAIPFIDKGKIVGSLAILRNISERKRIENAKNEFVSIVSHQLRTPLTTMNWYSEMLLNEKSNPLNGKQRKYLEEIYASIQRLGKLTKDLLHVSKIELGILSIEPEPTDLRKLIDIALSELLAQMKNKKLKVEKKYDKNLPIINVDPSIMRIILQNLISNAIKYTPERGKISISIKKQKHNALIEISDNGYGIPEAQQSQIFIKFFQAENIKEKDSEGTGLGLYLTKSILKHLGGEIWFKSKENKGSTFYVTIPLKGMKKRRAWDSINSTI